MGPKAPIRKYRVTLEVSVTIEVVANKVPMYDPAFTKREKLLNDIPYGWVERTLTNLTYKLKKYLDGFAKFPGSIIVPNRGIIRGNKVKISKIRVLPTRRYKREEAMK